jgi:prephenate dehydrogenase
MDEVTMTVKITIIGLGQIGASMGLALAKHKDQITTLGHDKSADIARKALQMEAVDKIERNLPASVEGASVVILALPFDQIYETLGFIAQDLREDVVVMDTAPVKSAVAGWVKELLPPKRHYVGLTPALNPDCLEETGTGIEAARADLFHKGLMAVAAPPGADSEALKLAADFVTLLGARPYFADLAEVDGMMASVHLLPGLAAAAFVETVTGQPSWDDIRKLAGKPFMAAARPLDGEESAALAEAALQGQANTVRVLDEYIAALKSLREDIAGEKKEGLQTRLADVGKRRAEWQQQRAKGDWQSIESRDLPIPKAGDFFWKQQLGGLGDLFRRRDKKPDAD